MGGGYENGEGDRYVIAVRFLTLSHMEQTGLGRGTNDNAALAYVASHHSKTSVDENATLIIIPQYI